MFGSPAVGIDTVQDVPGVVVDSTERADDSEALVARRLDAAHALVERSLDQHSTRLTQRYNRQRHHRGGLWQGRHAKIFGTKAVTRHLFWGFSRLFIPIPFLFPPFLF